MVADNSVCASASGGQLVELTTAQDTVYASLEGVQAERDRIESVVSGLEAAERARIEAEMAAAAAAAAAATSVAPAPTTAPDAGPVPTDAAGEPADPPDAGGPQPTPAPPPPAPAPVAPAAPPPVAPPPPPSQLKRARIPAEGLPVWNQPNPSDQPSGQAGGGLDVEILEDVSSGWARVRFSNGWEGWLDGRRLNRL